MIPSVMMPKTTVMMNCEVKQKELYAFLFSIPVYETCSGCIISELEMLISKYRKSTSEENMPKSTGESILAANKVVAKFVPLNTA